MYKYKNLNQTNKENDFQNKLSYGETQYINPADYKAAGLPTYKPYDFREDVEGISGNSKMKIETPFLNYCRKNAIPVMIKSMAGLDLKGLIVAFDNNCIVLEAENCQQLFYKRQVIHIKPYTPEAIIFGSRD